MLVHWFFETRLRRRGPTSLPRRLARGPSFFQADVRLGYRFRFGPRRLEVFGEVFNLTNRANFELAAADRRSTNFLTYTTLRAGAVPRTGQLGVRFTF